MGPRRRAPAHGGSLGQLKAAGFAAATLWVLEANRRARAFYEGLGWFPTGARKIDDRGDFVLLEVRYITVL